jgi:hypothetical protein
MPDFNTGNVMLELSDAYGRGLSGEFELRFRNLQLHSFDFLKKVQLNGQPLEVTGVPAYRKLGWRSSDKYRFEAVFISVPFQT